MNKEELQEAIGFLFEPGAVLGMDLYTVLKTNAGTVLRRADLGDANLPTEVMNGFIDYVNHRTNESEEVEVRPLSELNPLLTTIHYYDLDGLPEGLEIINSPLVAEEIPIFNFGTDRLEDIDAFLIKISSVENHVVLYKNHSHLNLLRQARVLYFIKDEERFAKPEEGILRFSFSIDFLKVSGGIFVYDVKCLEKQFKFDDILISNAKQKVEAIEALNFVENIEELQTFAAEKAGARKVLSIRPNSPVLALQFDQIRTFVSNHPYLRKRLKFNEDNSMFRFHTNVSRIYFIELLNDNFLTSDLTSIFYKTRVKDEMTTEQDEQEL